MKDNLNIIGVAGQMQNGKDTIADYIIKVLDDSKKWQRKAFATEVKRIFCDTFKVDLNFIEKWKTKQEIPEGFSKTVRKSLQFIGDGFREINSNIWVDLLFNRLEENAIVSDVRYINELRLIKENKGINIIVWRPGYENNDTNGSEAQLKPIIDFILKNNLQEGSIKEQIVNLKNLPYGIEYVDYYIKNDEDFTNLYSKIENNLVKYIKENEYFK